jgi:hypothetical protein
VLHRAGLRAGHVLDDEALRIRDDDPDDVAHADYDTVERPP